MDGAAPVFDAWATFQDWLRPYMAGPALAMALAGLGLGTLMIFLGRRLAPILSAVTGGTIAALIAIEADTGMTGAAVAGIVAGSLSILLTPVYGAVLAGGLVYGAFWLTGLPSILGLVLGGLTTAAALRYPARAVMIATPIAGAVFAATGLNHAMGLAGFGEVEMGFSPASMLLSLWDSLTGGGITPLDWTRLAILFGGVAIGIPVQFGDWIATKRRPVVDEREAAFR